MQDVIDPENVQPLKEPLVVDGRVYTQTAQGRTKAQGVADAINRFLQNLVIKCAKEEGVRDYYHVGVIGYGARACPALSGPLAGRELVPIGEVGNMPARIEERTKKVDDGAGRKSAFRPPSPDTFKRAGGTLPRSQLGRKRTPFWQNWVSPRHRNSNMGFSPAASARPS